MGGGLLMIPCAKALYGNRGDGRVQLVEGFAIFRAENIVGTFQQRKDGGDMIRSGLFFALIRRQGAQGFVSCLWKTHACFQVMLQHVLKSSGFFGKYFSGMSESRGISAFTAKTKMGDAAQVFQ